MHADDYHTRTGADRTRTRAALGLPYHPGVLSRFTTTPAKASRSCLRGRSIRCLSRITVDLPSWPGNKSSRSWAPCTIVRYIMYNRRSSTSFHHITSLPRPSPRLASLWNSSPQPDSHIGLPHPLRQSSLLLSVPVPAPPMKQPTGLAFLTPAGLDHSALRDATFSSSHSEIRTRIIR